MALSIDLSGKVALVTGAGRGLGRAIPLGRFGDPAELGPLAVFLCSEFSSYITGQAIIIDGGLSSI